jgi:hypothetical protein
MRLAVELNREEINDLQTPVVVESWDHRTYGKGKRVWLSEFSEKERAKAGILYNMFYGWYLRTGVPDRKTFRPETIHFIKRLVCFFSGI